MNTHSSTQHTPTVWVDQRRDRCVGDAGGEAERVKSVAYLRLRTGKNSPAMLLALGSGRDDGFDRQQGTELITFLADVLEERMKQCLGPKS